jgi:curved DNA-binding protein CbpA
MREARPDPDLYEVLEVAPTATAAEITTAYRRRVRDLHPDSRGDGGAPDPSGLADVLDAYDTLRDPAQRASYDAGRHRPPAGGIPITVRHVSTGDPPAGGAWLRAGPVRVDDPLVPDLLRLLEALLRRGWW